MVGDGFNGGNNGMFGNSSSASGSTADEYFDTPTWTLTHCAGGEQCLKVGNSSGGSATTPAFSCSGDAILSFKIAGWTDSQGSSETTNATITLTNATFKGTFSGSYTGNEIIFNQELTVATIASVPGEWKNVTLPITGSGDNVTIAYSAGSHRFWLDEVNVNGEAVSSDTYILHEKAEDNKAVIASTYNGTKDVTFTRTFSNDAWYSLCVPFDLTKAQVATIFGENADVEYFSGVTAGDNLTLSFSQKTVANDTDVMIEAGKAYIVYPTVANIENPVIEGVELKDVDPVALATTITVDGKDYKFVGMSDRTNIGSGRQYRYLTGKGQNLKLAFPKVGDESKMKGTRAYFIFPDDSNVSAKVDVNTEDETTGIRISTERERALDNAEIYTLQGMRITKEQMHKGIYIVNGKKFINK